MHIPGWRFIFQGLGWVPFEPTKGFNGEIEFYDSDLKQEVSRTLKKHPTNEEQTKKETRERQDTPDRETQSSVKIGLVNMKWFLKWTAYHTIRCY